MADQTFRKDPDETLDYGFDYDPADLPEGEDPFLSSGEIISLSSWTVPTGLTKVSDGNSATQTTVWLSGGTAGNTYNVLNEITTSDNRVIQRSFDLVVTDR